jgi:hypothetical protein
MVNPADFVHPGPSATGGVALRCTHGGGGLMIAFQLAVATLAVATLYVAM